MKFLLYGGNGWIGNIIRQYIENIPHQDHEVVIGKSRIDNYQSTLDEILLISPNRIICTTGRTSGNQINNIDYLEDLSKTSENLRDNLQGPMILANISNKLGIHMIYLGTGCIYHYDDTHLIGGKGFTEYDLPNFNGSQYSAVKGITDQLIRQYDNVLNARIRMPITYDATSPRDFINKIVKYRNIIDTPNSMTVIPDMLPILIDMSIKRTTGTINLTNPGVISASDIMDLYIKYIDHDHTYNKISLDQLNQFTIGKRSNNYLDTSRLQSLYPEIKDIHSSIINVFTQRNLSV